MELFKHRDLPQRKSKIRQKIDLIGILILFTTWITLYIINWTNVVFLLLGLVIYVVVLYLWSFHLSYAVLGWMTRNHKRDLDDVYYDIMDIQGLVTDPIDGIVDPLVMRRYEELHAERRRLIEDEETN